MRSGHYDRVTTYTISKIWLGISTKLPVQSTELKIYTGICFTLFHVEFLHCFCL